MKFNPEQKIILAIITGLELSKIFDGIKSHYFIDNRLKAVYDSLKSQYDKNGICDATTIDKLPDWAYVREEGLIPDIDDYIQILKDNYAETILSKLLREKMENGIRGMEALRMLSEEMENVLQENVSTITAVPVQDVAKDYINYMHEEDKEQNALFYGLKDLDQVTGGMSPEQFIIIAGRPSMGKTMMALNVAKHNCERGKKVLLFSLEMSNRDLMGRLVASYGEVDYEKSKLQKNNLNAQDIQKITHLSGEIMKWDLTIDESVNCDVDKIRRISKEIKYKNGLDLIIVDYVQIMSHPWRMGSKNDDVGETSRRFKTLAKELKIPVIALSQMSREGGKTGREPQLTDLRDSGALEQDADVVIFPHRPDYYGINTDPDEGDITGMAKMIAAKNRSGILGAHTWVQFQGQYQRFYDGQDFEESLPDLTPIHKLNNGLNNFENEQSPF